MSPADAAILLFSVFGALLLLGAPISISLGVSAVCVFLSKGQDLGVIVRIAYTSVNSFPIMAVPSFILAGALMESSGMSKRLVRIAELMIGPTPGGLAISTALACVFFGAISGSGPATTAAVGMIMIPAMMKRGYNNAYAGASAATAGGVGIIIPPSIPFVIYGITSQESITKLFLAGIIPGILITVGLALMHRYQCRHMEIDPELRDRDPHAMRHALKDGFWSILAPVIILGGIYGGIFTPTEAAVVAVFYTVFVGFVIHKELTFHQLQQALQTTSWMAGRVLVIMFTAYVFGRILVQNRIPDVIVNGILGITTEVYIIWFCVVFILLIFGMFMETLAIILLVTPVLLPVMEALGVDPIHFGVVLVCCCGVGFSTPPLGENMFIASGISGSTLEEISLKALPFCAVTIGVIFLIVLFPPIATFLPNMFGN